MGFVDATSEITHILVVSDPEESLKWYKKVLGASVHSEFGTGAVIKVMNNWFLITEGGEPTPDKPQTSLETPKDYKNVNSFFTIRVQNCQEAYEQLSDLGATFLTPPIKNGREIRCFFTDPDNHLFEISEVSSA